MRYLIDPEYRSAKAETRPRVSAMYAVELRRELSALNQSWALHHEFLHEVTLGSTPAVLYSEDKHGRHGNFLQASYQCIQSNPPWRSRLRKAHTSSKRALLSRDPDRRELDSSNSSDALLMNIFCHPDTITSRSVCQLLGIDIDSEATFGYKPRVPLSGGKKDCTEIDLKLGTLLIEAKLTEYDFQCAPLRLIERYPRFADIFDVQHPHLCNATIDSYQLVRGVLAADTYPEHRFCILCDSRRPDLIERWHHLLMLVTPYELRCRLVMLTWQELASVLPVEIQAFLDVKYGIRPPPHFSNAAF